MKQNTLQRKILVVLLAFAMIAISMGLNNWTTEEVYADSSSGGKIIDNQTTANGVPTTLEESELKWATQVGAGYSNATTSPLLLNGNLYVVGGGKLQKISKTTGEVLATSTDTVANAYDYFLSTDGTHIVFMCGTKVVSYNEDLTLNWESKTFTGKQGVARLYYDEASKNFYGGTMTPKASTDISTNPAVFFCISATNGSMVWEKNTTVGGGEKYTGAYWSGATVVGNYAIIGDGSGTVHAFDKTDGTEVSKTGMSVDGTNSICSGVVYSNGYIYYSTNHDSLSTAGYICKASFDSTTGKLGVVTSAKIDAAATKSISTPVVYNNRIYVGATTTTGTKGVVGVLNADTLENIYSVPLGSAAGNGGKGQDVTLVIDDANNRVIGYTTYYGVPGCVTCFTDTAGQTTAKYADFGPQITAVASQNCATQVAVDTDGTIYGTNDSGKIYAIGKNEAYLTSLSTGTGYLDNEFSSIDTDYEVVVPKGTESTELTFNAADSSEVKVQSTLNSTGKYTASLVDGKATVKIEVSSGSDSRTYTVNIRESKNDVGTIVASTTSNSITANYNAATLKDGSVFVINNAGVNNRVWIGSNDTNAVISNIKTLAGTEESPTELTKDNVSGDNTYLYRLVYSATSEFPVILKYTVTAENGTDAKDYYIVLTDKDDNSGFSIPTSIKLDKDTLEVEGLTGNTSQLIATTTEVGDGDKAAVTWASSDESIATVDQKGNVTAVSGGKATITATYGDYTAKCEVTSKVPAKDAVVYVTISNIGKIQVGKDGTNMAQAPVTVKDLNFDGVLSLDEALFATHNTYYPAGALVGYGSYSASYGTSLGKLWGDDSGNFGYYVNNGYCMNLDHEVKSGDFINAYITVAWPETAVYTFFGNDTTVVKPGEVATLTLKRYDYDASWNLVESPYAGGKAKLVQSKSRVADEIYTADENGNIKVSFDEEGTYYLQTYAEDGSVTPNVTKIIVTSKANEATDNTQIPSNSGNGNSTNTGSGLTVKTGDANDLHGWLMVLIITILAGSLVITTKKNKEE